jgi:hypothetical protein
MIHPELAAIAPNLQDYWLGRARFEAVAIAGRSLMPTEYTSHFVTTDRGRYRLPMRPVIKVTAIKGRVRGGYSPMTGNVPPGEWWDLLVSDCHLSPEGFLSLPHPAIWEGEITYQAGWDLDQPATESGKMLAQAVEDLAYALWKSSEEGTMGAAPQAFRVEGEYSISYGAGTVTVQQASYDRAAETIRWIVKNA